MTIIREVYAKIRKNYWQLQSTRGHVTPRSRGKDRHLYEFADAIVTQPKSNLPHKTTYFQR